MRSFWTRLGIVVIGLSLLGIWNLQPANGAATRGPASLQSFAISMLSPVACPQGGCGSGQTLTLLTAFPITNYDPALSPNLKVCVFMPNVWHVDANTFSMDIHGQTATTLAYSADLAACQGVPNPSNDYSLIGARQASVTGTWSADSLRMSFRIPWTAAQAAAVKVRVLTQKAGQWNIISDLTSDTIPLTSTGETLYVANDADACGALKPCYVNSGPDGPGGFGTGLKDAVDAIPTGITTAVINVVGGRSGSVAGKYMIKTNAVAIDQPVTVTSLSGSPATITYAGAESEANCAAPMLSLRDAVTVSNLFVDDGSCSNKHRSLIDVDPLPTRDITINILSNTLSGGRDAIFIHDIKAQVNILYNNIYGNSGYSLYWSGAANLGGLRAIANNMVAGSTAQVDCAGGTTDFQNNRFINHNYFGSFMPDASVTHCNSVVSKRLGAPIYARSGRPGVSATRVTVTDKMPTRAPTPTIAPTDQATATLVPFYGQLAFNRSGDGSQDFDMYIVDHGSAPVDSLPFARSSIRGVAPCSNYYDFFLPDGVNPPNTTLDLYFYYDTTSADCETLVRYSDACMNRTPTPANVPLLWYNPTAMPTAWAPVMQPVGSDPGQPVTCDTTQKLLHVAIDANGRPNLASDLNYTPLLIGSSFLKTFDTLAFDRQIRVSWTTSAEPDIAGYYLLRGDSESSLDDLAGMFVAPGNPSTGYSYSYIDSNLVNGKNYYYRLKIKRNDGQYLYSEVHALAPNTPTPVPSPTRTPITPTATASFTLVPSSNPTRAFTRTATFGPGTPSPTSFMLPTLTELYTRTPLFGLSGTPGVVPSSLPSIEPVSTQTPTVTDTLPPEMSTGTAIAMANENTPTPTRRPTRTATPEAVVASEATGSPTWLSLMLGLLAGAAVAGVAGAAWWYYRNKA